MKIRRQSTIWIVIIVLMYPCICALADGSTLKLPADMTIIGSEAFCGDTSLEKVVLAENTQEVRSRAFAESSLTEIDLPAGITFIAEDAFENTALITVNAQEGTYAYEWAVQHGYISTGTTPTATPTKAPTDPGEIILPGEGF